MAEDAVLIATGTDKPGVMDELSQFLLQHGANITESRSANLRGEFALLLLVRAAPEALDAIRKNLLNLSDGGISVELRPANSVAASDSSTFPFIFTATGTDQAGVLHRISHLLRVLNINIDHIRTDVAPDGAFQIRLGLAVPRETPITMVRDYLTYLCNELEIRGQLSEA